MIKNNVLRSEKLKFSFYCKNKTTKTEKFISVNTSLGERKINVEFQACVARKVSTVDM